jgi:hypothetical protein
MCGEKAGSVRFLTTHTENKVSEESKRLFIYNCDVSSFDRITYEPV